MSSDGLAAVPRGENDPALPGKDASFMLILYIAGRGPSSVRAMANLDALVEVYGRDCFEIETVDVLLEPQRALRDHILVTPTLIKLAPAPPVQIAGDLSDADKVIYGLNLDPGIWSRRGE